jgi:hypothetical protein
MKKTVGTDPGAKHMPIKQIIDSQRMEEIEVVQTVRNRYAGCPPSGKPRPYLYLTVKTLSDLKMLVFLALPFP